MSTSIIPRLFSFQVFNQFKEKKMSDEALDAANRAEIEVGWLDFKWCFSHVLARSERIVGVLLPLQPFFFFRGLHHLVQAEIKSAPYVGDVEDISVLDEEYANAAEVVKSKLVRGEPSLDGGFFFFLLFFPLWMADGLNLSACVVF